ncbi:MAG: acyl-CoA thioesterase [Crocinitomicaceae bacterium]
MIQIPLQIRFADCDIAGHIHNAVYLHYFETGRMHFFVSQLGKNWDWKKKGIILKKNSITYHQPSYLEDELTVILSCSHIGTKSFTLLYKIIDAGAELKAEGSSLLVCMDYTKNQSIEIPEKMRGILKKHLSESEA